MPTLSLQTPADYDLSRDVCSYGYFLLWPNFWDVSRRELTRVLTLRDAGLWVRVSQPRGPGTPLRATTDRALPAVIRREASAQLSRMLRLDEPASAIADFHRRDPRFAPTGRGRLMRSPTMFEDVIKTVTSCNVTWPSTVVMNRRLCEVFGPRAAARGAVVTHGFPTPARLARVRPQTLRARCRVGYRDARIVALAKLFASGAVDEAWFADPATPDDTVFDALTQWPGVGPYAAANIMQLLGRYSRLPLDTESVRHGRTVLGYRGTATSIMKRVHRHYAPMGPHAFRSYWFELWDFYERKAGPAHTWERDSTGKVFTASNLKKPGPARTATAP